MKILAILAAYLALPLALAAQITSPSNPSYGPIKMGQGYNVTLNNWVTLLPTTANYAAYPLQSDQYGNLTTPVYPGNVVPSTALTYTLGTAAYPWLTGYFGQVVNTTTPIRDQTRQVLIAAMTAVDTAGVNIGSTGTGNATFSWPVSTTNWYDLQCKLPVTFVASATIAFQLVSVSGSVTASFVNGESSGNTAASAAFQDLFATGTAITTPTTTTGAPGGVSEMVTVGFQFLTSHAGNIGIEFIGNGANNVQMLEGGECGLTQIN